MAERLENDSGVVLHLVALCTNQNKTENVKLTFDNEDIANTSVAELKVKIQNLISAPACDLQLNYLGQPLNDPGTKLGDLYIRHGDVIAVEYLEKAHIETINSHVKVLKKFLQSASSLCTSDGKFVRVPSPNDVEKLEDFYADIAEPLENLSDIFGKWKTVEVQADRHYFVQEKGLQCLMDIHGFSQKKYSWYSSSTSENCPVLSMDNDNSDDDDMDANRVEGAHQSANEQNDLFMRTDELVQTFNEWQVILNSLLLRVLWNFMEEGPETQLVLCYGGLKLMIDAYLRSDKDDIQPYIAEDLSENALGCLCGCIEYDPNVQREVAGNKAIMTKFVNMINAGLSLPRTCSRVHECSLVANTLFYLSFDQNALQTVVESGYHLKIMNSIQKVVDEEVKARKALIICYYCLLFLARVRSATLISIPEHQALAIDSYIKSFLQKGYLPRQIGNYEAELVYVWITLAPIVHMIFACGPGSDEVSCIHQDSTRDIKREGLLVHEDSVEEEQEQEEQQEEEMVVEDDDTEEEREEGEAAEAGREEEDDEEEEGDDYNDDDEGIDFCHNDNRSSSISFPSTENQGSVHKEWDTEPNNATRCAVLWPGSNMVQELGMFALQHTLCSQNNLELLISEDLHLYLLCLLSNLKGKKQEILARELMAITQSRIHVPSLKLICKAALARVNGLDAVRAM